MLGRPLRAPKLTGRYKKPRSTSPPNFVGGSAAPVLGPVTLSALGALRIGSSAAITIGAVTLSAGGQTTRSGSAAITIGSVTLVSAGGSPTAGGTLSWDAVSGATGYKVYWDRISGPPYANVVDVGNVTTYSPAWGSGTFYANIRSYDGSGLEGPWGTEITVTL